MAAKSDRRCAYVVVPGSVAGEPTAIRQIRLSSLDPSPADDPMKSAEQIRLTYDIAEAGWTPRWGELTPMRWTASRNLEWTVIELAVTAAPDRPAIVLFRYRNDDVRRYPIEVAKALHQGSLALGVQLDFDQCRYIVGRRGHRSQRRHEEQHEGVSA